MKPACDLANIQIVEFGVGWDDDTGQRYALVPVDGKVQGALREMSAATIAAMNEANGKGATYEPAEKHEATEYLTLPLEDALASHAKALHDAVNLPTKADALADPRSIFCYFARLTDGKKQRLTCVHRSTQFKAVLKSRLLSFAADALKMIEDKVFKLDNDFDFLIDNKHVHILRPSSFEFTADLQKAVLAAVPANVEHVSADLPFVDFSAIETYAARHPRAARHLASIRTLKEAKKVDKAALKKLCKANGVEIKDSKGKIAVQPEHALGFLEVLDRRRYELELVIGQPERYRANSRQPV